jgi:DNA topoisomerase-3
MHFDFENPLYSLSGRASWSLSEPHELFEAKVKKITNPDMAATLKNLKHEAKKASTLMLWLDCDREGESIASEVANVCQKINPALKSHNNILRAKFSSLTDSEIVNAMKFPVLLNEDFAKAVDARSEIDLRLGAIFTRWQQTRLRQKILKDARTMPYAKPKPGASVISYGPCQLPTLGRTKHQ